jgi:hypothetical protein
MGEDPLNTHFGEDWVRLTKDLLFDSEGSFKFKTHLWNDIRRVMLSTLVGKGRTDDMSNSVVGSLTLSGQNLSRASCPSKPIIFSSSRLILLSPTNSIISSRLRLGRCRCYFWKKCGIPKLGDSGLAGVVIDGEGLSVRVLLFYSFEYCIDVVI